MHKCMLISLHLVQPKYTNMHKKFHTLITMYYNIFVCKYTQTYLSHLHKNLQVSCRNDTNLECQNWRFPLNLSYVDNRRMHIHIDQKPKM